MEPSGTGLMPAMLARPARRVECHSDPMMATAIRFGAGVSYTPPGRRAAGQRRPLGSRAAGHRVRVRSNLGASRATPLHDAVRHEQVEVLRSLLAEGLDPNQATNVVRHWPWHMSHTSTYCAPAEPQIGYFGDHQQPHTPGEAKNWFLRRVARAETLRPSLLAVSCRTGSRRCTSQQGRASICACAALAHRARTRASSPGRGLNAAAVLGAG
jgi:hypothetical protein